MTAAAHDLRATHAIGEALAGSSKPFVSTSGTALLGFAALVRTGTEKDALEGGPRIDSENAVVALARRGVRSSVVRLAPTVHSALDRHGFVPSLVAMARKNGFAAYVGDGANRWPALHTLDCASLYRLALEKAPAGARLHGVAEEGIPFRDIAEAIARLGLPAKSIPAEDAGRRLGFLAISRRSTIRRPAPGRASSWDGDRRIRVCSRTSTEYLRKAPPSGPGHRIPHRVD